MVEVYTGAVRLVPAEQMPLTRRFVFFKNGRVVPTKEESDEVVPVVEVRRLTLDDHGNLVPAEKAARIRIEEFGPGGRPLQWTSMIRRNP
jgi:hypothetical protein